MCVWYVCERERDAVHAFADDGDTKRIDCLHDRVGDLACEVLLDLKGEAKSDEGNGKGM